MARRGKGVYATLYLLCVFVAYAFSAGVAACLGLLLLNNRLPWLFGAAATRPMLIARPAEGRVKTATYHVAVQIPNIHASINLFNAAPPTNRTLSKNHRNPILSVYTPYLNNSPVGLLFK